MTSADRQAMDKALKELVVPELRSLGFKGSLPHFRRSENSGLEVITFQFDKWGGGFVIEVACCSEEGFITPWGKEIPPNKVTTWDLPSSWRNRIQPSESGGTDAWFRFEDGQVTKAALEVLEKLPVLNAWFHTQAQLIAPADRPKAAPSGVR